MTDWQALREQIARDRGKWCECCGCAFWTELHHSLIHRMKGHPELDCIENLQAVCPACHPYQNGHETRRRFWQSQCELCGAVHMREWLDGLDLKVKESYE